MDKQPLYKRIKQQLTQALIDREWLPGEMLPSESRLAERYQVGISTIRAAVRELESANVLVRSQGKGTFVTQFDQREGIHRFLNIVRRDGVIDSPDRRLISVEQLAAPATIAEKLNLPRTTHGERVFKLSTAVSLGGSPIYYSNVWLPAARFPNLRAAHLPDGSQSLYSIYQQRFNVNVIRVVDALTATRAPAAVAKVTGMESGNPVLRLDRVAYTYGDAPVEVRQNWIDTTHHCYRIEQGDGG